MGRSRFAIDMVIRSVVIRSVVAWVAAALLTALASSQLDAQQDVPLVVRERLDEGDRHRAAGRLDDAVESYLEARRLGPSVVEVYTSLGALYAGQNQLEASLEAFSSGLELLPDDRQLLYNAAVIAMRLGRLDQALSAVEGALASHRNDADLHSLHGAVLSRLDRLDDALTALTTAAKAKPGDSQILFRLGNLQHQLDHPEAAIDAYRKAIKKDRSMLRAYYNLGAVLLETGQYDAALDAYMVALEPFEAAFASGQIVDVVHARAFQNLGSIYFQKNEWQPALDAYRKALRLDPQLTAALYNQGFIYFTLGQLDAAETAYREALKLDPELPIAYLHLGQIEQRRGALEAAIRWFSDGLPRLDESSRRIAFRALAESQDAQGRPSEAETAYRSLLELEPNDWASRLDLGRLLRRAGRLEQARQELESVRASAPEPLAAMMELAALAQLEGRTSEEKKLYQDMLQRAGSRPGMWPVRLNLALVHLRAGEVARAKPLLEALVRRKSPRSARVDGGPGVEESQFIATIHGLLLALDGNLPEGRKRVQAVLADDPGFAAASDVAAVLEAMAGQRSALQALAATLERRRGGSLEASAQANLGQMLWLDGRVAEARPHLDAAVAAFPQWSSLRVARGDIAVAEKRYADAIPELETAVKLCDSEASQTLVDATPADRVFRTAVRAGAPRALCVHASKSLALAQLGAAFEGLRPALANGRMNTVRQLADAALSGELDTVSRAIASYVRGTARLAQGAAEPALRDLNTALQGQLPVALRSLAHNNLGVAHIRLGNVRAAQTAFEAARSDQRSPAEATMNLGILFDDHADQSQQALELYRQYLKSGGAHHSEVAAWVERLERIY